MNVQCETSGVPPPRPPKSPALRRKEFERVGGPEKEEESVRMDIADISISPRRPPKPDRFKSPQHGFNTNTNNSNHHNIHGRDGAVLVATEARFKSKTGEAEQWMAKVIFPGMNIKGTTLSGHLLHPTS